MDNIQQRTRDELVKEAAQLNALYNPTEWTAWLERCKLAHRMGYITDAYLTECAICYVRGIGAVAVHNIDSQ